MAYENPVRKETALQNSATAIVKGNVVCMNDVANLQNVIISGSLTAKPRGIALEDSPAQSTTTKPQPFPICVDGPCKAVSGGTCTQGLYAVSDANGAVINATATGAAVNVIGRFLESGVSGDMVTVDVKPGPIFI